MKVLFLSFLLCATISGCVSVQAPVVVKDEGSEALYDADHMSLLVASSLEQGRCQNVRAFGALLYVHFSLEKRDDVEQLVQLYHNALRRQSAHGIRRDSTVGMFFERTIRQAERTDKDVVDFVYSVLKDCKHFDKAICSLGCYSGRIPIDIPTRSYTLP